MLERRVDLAFELSVVVARGADGHTAIYAPGENLHRDGILAVTTVPSASITPAIEADAVAATLRIAHALDYVGVLCVEFFVVRRADDTGLDLFVNEIAPRPHNSGHYSIDACVTSQFAQQARIAAGLPLGDTRRHSAAVMLNLLGDLWFAKRAVVDEVTVPGYADDPADADVDAQATADVDRLLARAEAAIADADEADEADDATLDDDALDDAAAVVEEPGRADAIADADDRDAAERGDRPHRASPDPQGDAVEPDWSAVLAHPGVNLHLYGKREARRGRKMGHVTIVAAQPDEARRIALEVAGILGIAGW